MIAMLDAGDCTVALCGPRGTGKTVLATWAAARQDLRTFTHRGHEIRPIAYRRAFDLFAELRNFERPELAQQLRTVGYLAIDEMHDRLGTDFEARSLANLIDHRHAERLTTVLASNLTPNATETWGASIVSRIRETGCIYEMKIRRRSTRIV